MAIDPAHGKIYWANWGLGDGSESASEPPSRGPSWTEAGAATSTPARLVEGPHGLAIDPVKKRIYWPNYGPDSLGDGTTISWANLNGSGGGNLNTGAATVAGPRGVAIDPATRRIYWANYGDGMGAKISYANLNGSGGGDLMTDGATVEGPEGVALDPPAGRIYWGNYGPGNGDTIAYANLNGTGNAHDLSTAPVVPNRPHGVALDPAERKDLLAQLRRQHDLLREPERNRRRSQHPDHRSEHVRPRAAVAARGSEGNRRSGDQRWRRGRRDPAMQQGSVGRRLDDGAPIPRSPDLLLSWTRDGHTVSGATSSSLKASSAGTYRCRVTARNAAGSTTQGSGPHAVSASNDFTFGKLKRNKHKGSAKLTVNVPGPGALTLSDAKKKLKPVSTNPSAAEGVKLPIKPRRKLAKKLGRKGKAKVNASVTFTPTGGSPNTESTKVKLVEKTGH